MPHKVVHYFPSTNLRFKIHCRQPFPLSLRLCGVSCDDTQIKERKVNTNLNGIELDVEPWQLIRYEKLQTLYRGVEKSVYLVWFIPRRTSGQSRPSLPVTLILL